MQIISQDRTKAITYKGVVIVTGHRGFVLQVISEGGNVFAVGHFTDYGKAREIVKEIINRYEIGATSYYVPVQ